MKAIGETKVIEVSADRGTLDELPFHAVSLAKLSLLSIATFGLYELYWFYKNWQRVKARTGSDISPFWRAVFSPLFCYSLAGSVNSTSESVNVAERIHPAPIALAYFGLLALQRLPDPWWLISWLSFVALIPIARQIHVVHAAIRPGFDSNVGWSGWSYVALIGSGGLAALVAAVTFGPPTRALPHAEIPASYETTLREAGVVQPGEEIQYFYSGGLLSILEDGNLFTDRRVISYSTTDGELLIASATYSEVADIEVVYSENSFEDTVVTVSTASGEEFLLIVSAEDGRDKHFVSALHSRVPTASP